MGCRQERGGILQSLRECQDKLLERKREIDDWRRHEQILQKEFVDLVGDGSPFLQVLLKTYKKKVKRKKRRRVGEDEDGGESSEEEDEDEDEAGESSDEEEEDVCPQGCDMGVYESVLELREKRLDMEESLAEIQKNVEELKKQHGQLLKDETKIEKEQQGVDEQIQTFQSEKQTMLNKVLIPLTLRLSQVQCLELTDEGAPRPAEFDAAAGGESAALASAGKVTLPEDLSNYLVFPSRRLERLRSRITELHLEKAGVWQSFRELRKELGVRKRAKSDIQKEIEGLTGKFNEIQILKFGRSVDLEAIESSQQKGAAVALRDRISVLEKESNDAVNKWVKKLDEGRALVTKETDRNSVLLEQIANLGKTKIGLDNALNSRLSNVTIKDDVTTSIRAREEETLKNQINAQAREIAALQQEIQLFRRKGGHIYTTVTTNRN